MGVVPWSGSMTSANRDAEAGTEVGATVGPGVGGAVVATGALVAGAAVVGVAVGVAVQAVRATAIRPATAAEIGSDRRSSLRNLWWWRTAAFPSRFPRPAS